MVWGGGELSKGSPRPFREGVLMGLADLLLVLVALLLAIGSGLIFIRLFETDEDLGNVSEGHKARRGWRGKR